MQPAIWAIGVVGAIAALWAAYGLLMARPFPVPHALLRAWPFRMPHGLPRAATASLGPGRGSSGAAWFGAATALAGVTGLMPLAGPLWGLPPASLAGPVAVAAIVVGAAFLPALLTVLRAAVGAGPWLRLGLDTAIVGLCLMFCCWSLFARGGRLDTFAYAVVAFHCWVLATAAVVGLRAGARRAGLLFCAAGIWASTLAVAGLAFALARYRPVGSLGVVGLLFVAAPILLWRGTTAFAAAGRPATPPQPVPSRATIVAVAVALAVFAALDLVVDGEAAGWGVTTIGIAATVAIGIRLLIRARASEDRPAEREPAVAVRAELFARTDPVTGLATRYQLSLAVAGERCESRGPAALLAIGIDGLDAVADPARDEALRELARRVAAAPGDPGRGQVVARLSETTFALLTAGNPLRAYGLASRLVTAIGAPLPVGGQELRPRAFVGLTQLADAPSTEEILRRAEQALRRARQLAGERVEWYDAEVEQVMQRQAALERALPGALRGGELELVYQPIMDLVRARPVAVEALLRWRHPHFGTLLPGDVLPVAQDIGALGELGHWVLGEACSQLRSWRREGHDLSMAVNISAREAAGLAVDLQRLLAAHDLPPNRLVLEVAESDIDDNECLAEQLGALRSLGLRTAIDSFGAGPQSLHHLRRVPIDMVKIGPSFFDTTEPAGAAAPLVEVIVGVGRRLGVEVVAHGLEAPQQLDVVRTAGCRVGQGHLFARPQPAERTEAYLAGFSRLPVGR